jgi:hypothetical protein
MVSSVTADIELQYDASLLPEYYSTVPASSSVAVLPSSAIGEEENNYGIITHTFEVLVVGCSDRSS